MRFGGRRSRRSCTRRARVVIPIACASAVVRSGLRRRDRERRDAARRERTAAAAGARASARRRAATPCLCGRIATEPPGDGEARVRGRPADVLAERLEPALGAGPPIVERRSSRRAAARAAARSASGGRRQPVSPRSSRIGAETARRAPHERRLQLARRAPRARSTATGSGSGARESETSAPHDRSAARSASERVPPGRRRRRDSSPRSTTAASRGSGRSPRREPPELVAERGVVDLGRRRDVGAEDAHCSRWKPRNGPKPSPWRQRGVDRGAPSRPRPRAGAA